MKANTIKKIAALALSAAVAISAVPTTTAFAADTTQTENDRENTETSEYTAYIIGEVTGGALKISDGTIEVTTGASFGLAVTTGAPISATTDTAIAFGDDFEFVFPQGETISDPVDFSKLSVEAGKTYTATKVYELYSGDDVEVENLDKLTITFKEATTGDDDKKDDDKKDDTGVTTPPAIDTNPSNGSSTGTTTTPTTPATPDDGKTDETPAEPAAVGTTLKDSSKNTYKVTAGKKVQYTGTKSKAATVKVPATVTINGVTYKVTSIKAGAFKGNKTVKTITVGKNVTTIGKNAFANCAKLKTVKLGNKVTKIGAKAFTGCKNLKVITINSKKLTNSSLSNTAFKGISKNVTIKVPKSKVATYKKLFVKNGLNKNVKIKAI